MKKIVRSSAIMMTFVLGYIAILMVGQAIPREFVIKNVQTSYEELKLDCIILWSGEQSGIIGRMHYF